MLGLGNRDRHQQEPSTSASYAASVGAGTALTTRGGEFSVTTDGDYWVTRNSCEPLHMVGAVQRSVPLGSQTVWGVMGSGLCVTDALGRAGALVWG